MTAAPTAMWSGCPEKPSGAKVMTTSGSSSLISSDASRTRICAVDLGEFAVWIVETSGLGQPQLVSGRIQLLRPDGCQGGPGRRAGVPDLAGAALGERDDADLGAGTRVLREGAAGAEGLVIGMGEDLPADAAADSRERVRSEAWATVRRDRQEGPSAEVVARQAARGRRRRPSM